MKMFVRAKKDGPWREATLGDTEAEAITNDQLSQPGTRRKRRKIVKVIVVRRATPGGTDQGIERDVPVDIPRFRFANSDQFEKPWHLALWAPHDPDGPTVVINVDSPVLQEIVQYHQAQYPDVYVEEVGETVRQVFGEVATCKIAHSQKLAKLVTEEELDRDYRSEAALTVGLMGLLAEESLISQRLGKLGKKKGSAVLLAATSE
jgi:hypothetical protein